MVGRLIITTGNKMNNDFFKKACEFNYKSKTYFVADLHFAHPPILKHCNRPFKDTDEMDSVLISNWNNMIKNKNDTVYIIGDFAYKNHGNYLKQLNGRKILIEGNHDAMSAKDRMLFKEYFDFGLNRKFRTEINNVSRHVVLCHYVMATWYGDYHFYGHSHGRWYEDDYLKRCDVGVDVWGFHPVPFEVLEFLMESRKTDFNAYDFDFNQFKKIRNVKQHNLETHMLAWEQFLSKYSKENI
jgi:calcineurin-like phosphoesterase family protein